MRIVALFLTLLPVLRFKMQGNLSDGRCRETWIEGMDVFHNPDARVPLDPALLPGAAHHWLQDDGRIHSLAPAWQPLSSQTLITIEP